MQLQRPLVTLDIESTGTDPQYDRIIDLAFTKVLPNGDFTDHSWRLNPQIPIPQRATEVHGITDADVADKPLFAQRSREIMTILDGSDILGFAPKLLDIPILWEELYRCGITWDWKQHKVVDACHIFKLHNPRDLTAALKHYCGQDHREAHGAMADVKATLQVFRAQLERHYQAEPISVSELHDLCATDQDGNVRLDLAGTVVLDSGGVARYTHKKVRGVAVRDDLSYADWLLRSNFPSETKIVLRKLIDEIQHELNDGQPSLFE